MRAWRSRRLRVFFSVLAVAALLACGTGAWLLATGFSPLRGLAARLASRAAGRRVTIAGTFRLSLGRTLHLTAGRLTVAGGPPAPGTPLASVDRLDLAIAAGSLFRGPLHVERLEARGVRLLLASDRQGRRNWEPEAPSPRQETPVLPRVDTLILRDFRVTRTAPDRARPLELALDEARLTVDPVGTLALAARGRLDGRALHLAGRAGPLDGLLTGGPFQEDLRFGLGRISGTVRGRVESFLTLAGSSLDLAVAGPDLAELTELLGAPGAGHGPFRVTATARPAGSSIGLHLAVESPLLVATARGRVTPGSPPAVDLELDTSGRDLAALASLAGFRGLPSTGFTLRGHVRARGFPLQLERVSLRAGATGIDLDGPLGEPPGLAGTDLSFAARRVDGRLVGRLAGIPLPPGPLDAAGRLAVTEAAVRLADLSVSSPAGDLRGTVTIGREPGPPRVEFRGRVAAKNLATWGPVVGADLPGGPFSARCTIAVRGPRVSIRSAEGTFAGARFRAAGTVITAGGGAGTTLELDVRGADLAAPGARLGIRRLPAGPFQASARLVLHPDTIGIEALDASCAVGHVTGTVTLGRPPGTGPVILDLQAKGQDLAAVGLLAGLSSLPPRPFRVVGKVTLDGRKVTVSPVHLVAGDLDLSAEGRIVRVAGFRGTDLELRLAGRHLGDLGPLLGGRTLPDIPFRVAGGVAIGAAEIALRHVEAALGTSRVRLDGTVAPPGDPPRVRLRLDVSGPDPADLRACLAARGISVPPLPRRPFAIRGEVRYGERSGLGFHPLHLELGALRADLEGRLGAPPRFAATRLAVTASGGNAVNLEELTGRRIEVEGLRFEGLVRSAPPGRQPAGPPLRFEGKLAARRLALGPRARPGGEAPGERRTDRRRKGERARKNARLFPDAPLHFRVPASVEGTFDCRIDELLLGNVHLAAVHVPLVLGPERLRAGPLSATDEAGGRLGGTLRLGTPGGRIELDGELSLEGSRLGLLLGTPRREDEPPVDLRVSLHAAGRSLHELAAAATGRFSLFAGTGQVPQSALDRLAGSVLAQLLDAINPFRKKDPRTTLECAAVGGVVKNGQVRLDPLGLRTARVTAVASGTIDLASERIDVIFTTRPRRGIGISAGTIANAWVRLGGTLAAPRLQVRPLSAAVSAGMAVGTGGLSLLFRGLWNRLRAEEDSCTLFREKIDELWRPPADRADEAPGTATGHAAPGRGKGRRGQ